MALGPASLVADRLHPCDLVLEPGDRPVCLHVDGLNHTGTDDVVLVLGDRVVAPDRLIRPEDARLHRPAEPHEIVLDTRYDGGSRRCS